MNSVEWVTSYINELPIPIIKKLLYTLDGILIESSIYYNNYIVKYKFDVKIVAYVGIIASIAPYLIIISNNPKSFSDFMDEVEDWHDILETIEPIYHITKKIYDEMSMNLYVQSIYDVCDRADIDSNRIMDLIYQVDRLILDGYKNDKFYSDFKQYLSALPAGWDD